MRNKTLQLECFANDDELKIDVLCISEHFLHPYEVDHFVLSGFTMASCFARPKIEHGGVIILLKPGLNFTPLLAINGLSIEKQCEVTAIEIPVHNLIIVTIYRPPGNDITTFLNVFVSMFNFLAKRDASVIILGDFNIYFNTKDPRFLEFRDLYLSFGYSHSIFTHTRNKKCIDNIITNVSDSKQFNTFVYNPGLSDHKSVHISLDVFNASSTLSTMKFRPLTQSGKIKFFNIISSTDFSFTKHASCDINTKFSTFMSILVSAIETSFPPRSKLSSKTNHVDWFNDDLKSDRDTLRLLSELYHNSPEDLAIRSALKRFQSRYKRKLTAAKKKSYAKYIGKCPNKPKAYWNIIKSNKNSNTASKSPSVSPDIVNSNFANTAADIHNSIPPSNCSFKDFLVNENQFPQFTLKPASYNQIRDIITSMRNKTAKDHFGMNILILLCVLNQILIPLTDLFNDAIKRGVYPDILKISKILPLYKSGPVNLASNFRPIALVPILSKILESYIKNEIIAHFQEHNMFFSNQYGFLPHRSTNMAISRVVDGITEGMEKGLLVKTSCFDLQKAFDCISANILIEKLKSFNFEPTLCRLIKSYLSNRYQYTHFDGVSSSLVEISHGVPQGSVLGPLLFLIYINDIQSSVPGTELALFADDTTKIEAHKNEQDLFSISSETEHNLHNWFSSNFLKLNETKTTNMIFSHRKTNFINPESQKLLGVLLDPVLSWGEHVIHVAQKLSKNIYLLRCLSKLLPKEALLSAFHALISSHLCYAITTWGHSCHASRLFALQRKALRIISDVPYRDDVRSKFISNKVLTLPSMYILYATLAAKQNCTVKNGDFHNYQTRIRDHFRLPSLRLNSSRNSNYFGPMFFNLLPDSWKQLPSNKLKSILKTHLLSSAYYDINEFLIAKVDL